MPDSTTPPGPPSGRKPLRRTCRGDGIGRAQLSLVEHALCPLDTSASLVEHLVHETQYGYTDRNNHTKTANVRVLCPAGLSPADELVLWGLLALTFSQSDPEIEFQATPHYCLRQLGIIDSDGRKGGKQYAQFRETVRRLARVIYENTAFYDPVRGEHRDVAFGLLKYSLPIDPQSSRAWRILWDPLFFEFCQATAGSLCFDLETYRKLDYASRRLFVLLQKIFWRREQTHAFDVRLLCVHSLGFAPTIDVRLLKQKLERCIRRLVDEEIVAVPDGVSSLREMFEKRGVGMYTVTFRRGAYFDRERPQAKALTADDSPLVDPLRSIGFDDGAVGRILRTYSPRIVQEWADITLAALERRGEKFFTNSPQAYFLDNVKHAADGRRTPPDWWRELRVQELRRETEQGRSVDGIGPAQAHGPDADQAFRKYLETEAREVFHKVSRELVEKFMKAGRQDSEATRTAEYMARMHLWNRFRREHPEFSGGKPKSIDLGSLMNGEE